MAYNINLSDGTSLVPGGLADGSIDNKIVSSLVLIGKNYAGYGEFLNENFIQLMENFSKSSAPVAPLQGQIWWDSSDKVLKVWNGSVWKISTGATSATSSNRPSGDELSNVGGDLWYDSSNGQLRVFNGLGTGGIDDDGWILIGPTATVATGDTGSFPALISDSPGGGAHVVIQNRINGIVYSIFAKETFSTAIAGFATIKAGLNFSSIASPALSLPNVDVNATASTIVQRNGAAGITVTTLNASTVLASSISASGSSVFATAAAGSVQALAIGNVTPGTGIFTTLTTTGNVNAANVVTTGTITTAKLTVSGTTNLSGTAYYNGTEIATVGGSASFTAINNTIIGNVTPAAGTFTTVTATTILPSGNLSADLGSSTAWFNNIYGTAIHAKYADLAERFEADQPYEAGTVVELGGSAEITSSESDLSEKVFGVISTSAAYLMNSGAGNNESHPPVAVQGRVPVKVIGRICKGDRLVSAGNGMARAGARSEISTWNVIGRALEHKYDDGVGVIEAVVKLNS